MVGFFIDDVEMPQCEVCMEPLTKHYAECNICTTLVCEDCIDYAYMLELMTEKPVCTDCATKWGKQSK